MAAPRGYLVKYGHASLLVGSITEAAELMVAIRNFDGSAVGTGVGLDSTLCPCSSASLSSISFASSCEELPPDGLSMWAAEFALPQVQTVEKIVAAPQIRNIEEVDLPQPPLLEVVRPLQVGGSVPPPPPLEDTVVPEVGKRAAPETIEQVVQKSVVQTVEKIVVIKPAVANVAEYLGPPPQQQFGGVQQADPQEQTVEQTVDKRVPPMQAQDGRQKKKRTKKRWIDFDEEVPPPRR